MSSPLLSSKLPLVHWPPWRGHQADASPVLHRASWLSCLISTPLLIHDEKRLCFFFSVHFELLILYNPKISSLHAASPLLIQSNLLMHSITPHFHRISCCQFELPFSSSLDHSLALHLALLSALLTAIPSLSWIRWVEQNQNKCVKHFLNVRQ